MATKNKLHQGVAEQFKNIVNYLYISHCRGFTINSK